MHMEYILDLMLEVTETDPHLFLHCNANGLLAILNILEPWTSQYIYSDLHVRTFPSVLMEPDPR